ncbi:hypothetical protein EHW61_15760 [Salinivibrio sp. VYel6]|uniref:hypothetical protein n=1 Tax=Salinivibrio sp. VYel6 TaxID=2490493 RepID=UPI00128DEEB4|nr:hypothetical protein [Salinivibrio sp. VYel6]MPX98091.1 hypothetical protein [Salinivibrio sp. VYel6]
MLNIVTKLINTASYLLNREVEKLGDEILQTEQKLEELQKDMTVASNLTRKMNMLAEPLE